MEAIRHNDFLTQNDYQQALEQLIQPLRKKMIQAEHPGLKLGSSGAVYDQQHAEMEALIRPLWGLAPYWTLQKDPELQASYLKKISQGTDPTSPDYWGKIEAYDQYIVELAAVALTLLLHKDAIWTKLATSDQQNLVSWLQQALMQKTPKNNWLFFKLLIQTALYHCDEPLDQGLLTENLQLIDSMYLEAGWYFDGKQSQKDYYVAFAFHYYGLIFATFMKEQEPVWAQIFIDRATLFAKDFIYYFAESGEALPFGRSATYRFAQGAFFSALIFAEVEALPWGQMKTLLAAHMKNWLQHDIFTFDGRLSIGYHYENLVIAEGYNAPGSPYWALKTFLLLATKPTHPFWKAKPEPIIRQNKKLLVNGNMLLVRTSAEQHVLGFPAGMMIEGQAHAEAKYSKFVYSTIFGFSVPKASVSYAEGAYDNVLAVSLDGKYFRPKRVSEQYTLTQEKVSHEWSPFEQVQIKTDIYPLGEWHLRIHEIKTTVSLELREGGFSVPLLKKTPIAQVTKDFASVKAGQLTSSICAIEGYDQANILQPEANTSLFFPRTSLPYLQQRIAPGCHRLICLVGGCYELKGGA